jgi:hypothetical protein
VTTLTPPLLTVPDSRIAALLDRLSNEDDAVHISKVGDDRYMVTINGESEYVTAEQLKAMKFDLRGGDDTLIVDENVDVPITANGGKGDDTLIGSSGDDKLWGGRGNDRIEGRGGDDMLGGVAGESEVLIGGAGKDIFHMKHGKGSWLDFVAGEDEVIAHDRAYMESGESSPGTESSFTKWMSGMPGFAKGSPNLWTARGPGMTFSVSQPDGDGDVFLKWTFTSGANKGMTVTIPIDPSTGKFSDVDVEGGSMDSSERKSLEALIKEGQLDGLDSAFSSVKKKKSGGSSTTGAGDASIGGGGSSSTDSIDGYGDASGLDTSGVGDMRGSWFITLAIGMGTIMNKIADRMIRLLNEIKAAGDDPPYKLTAEFQATAQMLSFMQQAFMAALNSLGESIKTGVTAGGAAR